MHCCVTEIGLFFKYSPKRAQPLEGTLKQENIAKDIDNRTSTTKIKLFCETRWIEWHAALEEMYDLYDPLLKTLHKINTEHGRNSKISNAAYSLMKCITNPTFIVALNVCSYTLGFTKKYIGNQFLHMTKCHLLQKVFKLQVLWSSHQFIKQG